MTDTIFMTAEQIRGLLREHIGTKRGAQIGFARTHGINQSYIAQVLNGISKPGPKICSVLGVVRIDTPPRRSAGA